MKSIGFEEAVAMLLREDPRYSREAYFFMRDVLAYASEKLQKPAQGPERHLSARDLMNAAREFALEQYGPLALRVLAHFGISSTEDLGAVVFNLVDKGVLGKTEEDRIEDFAGGYDFERTFKQPFLPARNSRKASCRLAE
jgi:uncharacterized repeat protein (TIGR04138 family)